VKGLFEWELLVEAEVSVLEVLHVGLANHCFVKGLLDPREQRFVHGLNLGLAHDLVE